MKRLQKATKRSLTMSNTTLPTDKSSSISKKSKLDMPWLVLPEFGEDEEKEMKSNMAQLRKVSRASKVDQAVVKTLMKSTFPIRRKLVLTGESIGAILKNFPVLVQASHVG